MYCGEVNLSGDNVLCVLYSAKKYMLPGLEKKCQEFLDSRLDVSNVCAVLEQVNYNGKMHCKEKRREEIYLRIYHKCAASVP